MIGLYDKNDVLITRLVDNVVASPDVIEVKNRTLDGQYHIQQIGTAAWTLNVKASLKLSEKDQLDTIKSTSDLLKVIFDGRYYIGLIDGKVDYNRRKFTEYPMFEVTFTMLVRERGDAV
jgi:hypothetical protein